MNPIQALEIILQAAASAHMPLKDHQLVLQAAEILRKELTAIADKIADKVAKGE